MATNRVRSKLGGVSSKSLEQLGNGQALVKKVLMVFEGTHNGMFGPVNVTKDFLELMAERFNREYANPKNENDYPPILKNHSRDADDVMGRILPPLVVEEFENPRTGETVSGLFGTLRIDDEVAQANVIKGKYSHVSVSFDDERDNEGELFEISFVAVEAARGAQVLKKGEKNMSVELQKKLDQTEANVKSLQKKLSASNKMVNQAKKNLSAKMVEAKSSLKELGESLGDSLHTFKEGVLKSQFKDLVRQGKLTKAEYEKINLSAISKMDSDSQKILLESYTSRPVSTDVAQFGNTAAKPTNSKEANLSSARIRELMKMQKSGKGLSKEEEKELEGHDEKDLEGEEKGDDISVEVEGLTMDDMEDAMSKLKGLGDMKTKLEDIVKGVEETLSALQGDKEEEEE